MIFQSCSNMNMLVILSVTTAAQAEQAARIAQRQWLRLSLAVLLLFVVMMFLLMLALSLLRQARRRRKRLGLGRRGERTEYIDAWASYRLKDDPTAPPPDEQTKEQ